MKTWSVLLVALCMAIGVVACTDGGTDPTEPQADPKTDAPAAVVTPDPAPVTEPAVAVTPAPVETPAAATPAAPTAAAGGLEGTTWKVGEYTVAFLPESKVSVSGGDLQGIEGTYTLENGQVTVMVLGQSKTGTWDGTTLTIDDEPAQKV